MLDSLFFFFSLLYAAVAQIFSRWLVIYVFTKGPFFSSSNNKRRKETSETGDRAGVAVDSGLRGEGAAEPPQRHGNHLPGDVAQAFGLMCNRENEERGADSGK